MAKWERRKTPGVDGHRLEEIGYEEDRVVTPAGDTISGWQYVCSCGYESHGFFLTYGTAIEGFKMHVRIETGEEL
ncbi:hypothetical protein SEA_THUNDERCLAP_10 [Arthrobacter phage Thunderclap]|uniref:Uncharacterized protein n=1 Tax=Arthrobacter phage Thunderclap TaxID=2777309 RepID=A0A7M1RQT4_9CAUD|nr:hypothetical protein SEA_THUNDERCLAP_10 [Arthrobacter phage Thunderclap]